MAEYLIYNDDSWMDRPSVQRPELTGFENAEQNITEDAKLSLEQKTINHLVNQRNFNARYKKNDIVGEREDGTGMCGLEYNTYRLLKVPGVKLGEYAVGTDYGPDNLASYKSAVSWVLLDGSGIVFDKLNTATITRAQFNAIFRLKDIRINGRL